MANRTRTGRSPSPCAPRRYSRSTDRCCPGGCVRSERVQRAQPNRSSRARHRSPRRRSLAGGGRRPRVEPRGRRGVHPRRVREGVLRRPDRGLTGSPLPRPRVPDSRSRAPRASARRARRRVVPSQAFASARYRLGRFRAGHGPAGARLSPWDARRVRRGW